MGQASLFGKKLPPKLSSIFKGYCQAYPNDKLNALLENITAHVQELEFALSRNEFLDIATARRIAEVLEILISGYDQYSTEQQAMIAGATQYFIQEQDVEPDTKSILGLDDDVQVINYVLDKIDRSELKVSI